MQLFAEKGDFSNKKDLRDPKSGFGLLRDPGLPKRDPVGSSAKYVQSTCRPWQAPGSCVVWMPRPMQD